jgi:predicted NBD/HSP70 family sugar kinase
MNEIIHKIKPKYLPALDKNFCPPALVYKAFQEEIKRSNAGVPLVIGLERLDGCLSRFTTQVFPDHHPKAHLNMFIVERIFKFLLWQRGGWKAYLGGPKSVGNHIHDLYAANGERSFDYHFMGQDVYEKPFSIIICTAEEVPPEKEQGKPLGRNLHGYRIGFDLGASDRKVSAVIDGEPVFSEEIMWNPKVQSDPAYHYQEIMTALKSAKSHLPRVDAIGGSSAGIYIDNQVRIASLFRGIPEERYQEIRDLFKRIQAEWDVPLEIVNDGDVTALAGSMSLEDNGVLGIAMGSSEAGGYVNLNGNITGWLNELAFAPVDYNPEAPLEEWSGDRGVGALYFSQQCVFRLAPAVDIVIPPDLIPAEKLEYVQDFLEKGHQGVIKIWQSMGIYLGYTIAHYANFYALKHVLILGRCTSGKGGDIILEGARRVLQEEFPELSDQINIQLPDEKSRRVGQAIAAASLPSLEQENK